MKTLKNLFITVLVVVIIILIGFSFFADHKWFVNWTAVGAVATLILAGGIGVAIWQIRETRKSTSAQIAIGLSQKVRDEEVLKILQKIYELEPECIKSLPHDVENKDQQLENDITQVLDNLDLLGALVAQGIIAEDVAIVVYGGPTALKCWYKLNKYIKDFLRQKRHSSSCRYLEDFAARTLANSEKKGVKIYFYRKKPEDAIDLIEYFHKNPQLCPIRYK